MLRMSLFFFTLCLSAVTGSLYQARQNPIEELMLIQDDTPEQNRLILVDPASDRDFVLTDVYYSMSFMAEQGDWFYFLGEDGAFAPHNIPKFYRIHRHTRLRQDIFDDAYGQALTKIVWEQEKVFYVRRNGDLAVVNFDGTENHDLPLPSNIKVLQSSSATFSLSDDLQMLTFASPQGENVDFMRLSLTDGKLENLTEALESPHRCATIYLYEKLTIVKCNDIFYYARENDSVFYRLLPDIDKPDLYVSNLSDDETLLYLYDQLSPARYEIDLTDEHDPPAYREIEPPTRETESTNLLLAGSDWEVIAKQVEFRTRRWRLVHEDGTETKLFKGNGNVSSRPLANGYYLITWRD